MKKHSITIIQSFKVEREITIEIEGSYHDEAREKLESGEIDAPDFNDPAWETKWVLQREEII